ncbi:MAG TPA: hypothetical protein VMU33_04950 [Burkholderiaceae bacterium]|nr:hypothetical protein [Burkholderiaceae bacterium]
MQSSRIGSGKSRTPRSAAGAALASAAALALLGATTSMPASGQTAWMTAVHQSALGAPLPYSIQYALGTIPAKVPANELDLNLSGILQTVNQVGPTTTANNAFFQSLGTNGRSCATCHQPPNGMGVSVLNVRTRYLLTLAHDPIFAPVDGANCPSQVPVNLTSPAPSGGLRGLLAAITSLPAISDPKNPYSVVLNRGAFRIFLPWPPKDPATGNPITPEITIKVLSDPTKCETDPNYGLSSATPVVSVYRRPLISTNLKFVTAQPGNIMWDGREPSLESQATNATLGHAQAAQAPTAAQVAQIVAFENALYSAQVYDVAAHGLQALGATGGPASLVTDPVVLFNVGTVPVFTEYGSWATLPGTAEAAAARESVARGEAIFNTRTFTIAGVEGFNDVAAGGQPVPGNCASCHNSPHSGHDSFPGAEHDLGEAGDSAAALPAPDLPLFQITCTTGNLPFSSTNTVTLHDPGVALVSGKCADVGKFKVGQLRALAARAPYFHDGSAADLGAVVDFYNRRFAIGYTAQERTDLINFLRTL